MKKIYTFILFIAISVSAFSQLVVVGTGFNNYAGTSATTPSGWYISWHSTSSPSYYVSAGNFGATAPSYKLGQDSVVIISPNYQNADSLSFWCKGNGAPFAKTNELHIYHSADSSAWNIFYNADSLPIAGTTIKCGLPAASGWLMFVYRKISGNLAFDDVNIIAYPNIYAQFSAPGSICLGDSICFTDLSISNNGNINSWNWTFGDGNSSTQQNPCHNYLVAGPYTVTLIVANTGSDTDTTVVPVTVYPTPVAGFSSTLTGNVVAFTNISAGGTSYLWNFGDGNFSNLQNPNPYSYWTAGTYTICLTVTNTDSCLDVFCQSVTITTVGINEIENFSPIIISPTISENGIFTIHNSLSVIEAVEVYNTVGEKMKRIPQSSGIKFLNLSDFPSGIYFVKILSENEEVTKKIIISR
ncbi:MAG: PKD domain-containing protein [Bacteroidetes bacterium]|nr:PKD domain-containing protein [Bacteroidota bacterium]